MAGASTYRPFSCQARPRLSLQDQTVLNGCRTYLRACRPSQPINSRHRRARSKRPSAVHNTRILRWRAGRESPRATGVARACDARDALFYAPRINNLSIVRIDRTLFCVTVAPSRSPRASPETSQSRNGMRRPARVVRNHVPGRLRNPSPPPLRADAISALRASSTRYGIRR